MLVLPLVLIVLVATLFAWMLHAVTVYALPLVAGWGAAALAFKSGTGPEGAGLVGIAAAVATFTCLRFILAQVPDGPMRSGAAVLLILPSLILGYNIGLDILEGIVPSDLWRQAISIAYALFGGRLAFARLAEAETRHS
ncbi:MAG: hypothetical protein HXY28_13960 [Hydrogenophilaceae bacterium]|jgi:hypothetical protein|nr:hypothetical protein [Hydrogenophilaceae bacterium]